MRGLGWAGVRGDKQQFVRDSKAEYFHGAGGFQRQDNKQCIRDR